MITLRIDMAGLTESITSFQDQIPFATSLALNRVANAAQQAERAGIGERFTIRRPWVLQGVKIENRDRATKRNLEVTIGIDAQRSFLSKFEAGGIKVPLAGGKSIAVPEQGVRPDISSIVPKSKRPRAFNFVRRTPRRPSGFTVYEGSQRTFFIQQADGSGLIFQRTGKGRGARDRNATSSSGHDDNLKILYVTTPHVRIPAELEFATTIQRVVREQFAQIFAQAFEEAKASAR